MEITARTPGKPANQAAPAATKPAIKYAIGTVNRSQRSYCRMRGTIDEATEMSNPFLSCLIEAQRREAK